MKNYSKILRAATIRLGDCVFEDNRVGKLESASLSKTICWRSRLDYDTKWFWKNCWLQPVVMSASTWPSWSHRFLLQQSCQTSPILKPNDIGSWNKKKNHRVVLISHHLSDNWLVGMEAKQSAYYYLFNHRLIVPKIAKFLTQASRSISFKFTNFQRCSFKKPEVVHLKWSLLWSFKIRDLYSPQNLAR